MLDNFKLKLSALSLNIQGKYTNLTSFISYISVNFIN